MAKPRRTQIVRQCSLTRRFPKTLAGKRLGSKHAPACYIRHPMTVSRRAALFREHARKLAEEAARERRPDRARYIREQAAVFERVCRTIHHRRCCKKYHSSTTMIMDRTTRNKTSSDPSPRPPEKPNHLSKNPQPCACKMPRRRGSTRPINL